MIEKEKNRIENEEIKKPDLPAAKKEEKKKDDPAAIQEVIDQSGSYTDRTHNRTHVRSEDSTPNTI